MTALMLELRRAQERGFIGPGPVEDHVERALDMLAILRAVSPSATEAEPGAVRGLDLGSGGGLPGLPLALALPEWSWVLLDGSLKRADFLREAVENLSLSGRVQVRAERAETAGRSPDLRGTFDVVVARSFGSAAVTAECASPFLRLGGTLVVAEPPGGAPRRWPAEGLAALGLTPRRSVTEPSAFRVLEQVSLCPDRFPRRVGIPAKRPLF